MSDFLNNFFPEGTKRVYAWRRDFNYVQVWKAPNNDFYIIVEGGRFETVTCTTVVHVEDGKEQTFRLSGKKWPANEHLTLKLTIRNFGLFPDFLLEAER